MADGSVWRRLGQFDELFSQFHKILVADHFPCLGIAHLYLGVVKYVLVQLVEGLRAAVSSHPLQELGATHC